MSEPSVIGFTKIVDQLPSNAKLVPDPQRADELGLDADGHSANLQSPAVCSKRHGLPGEGPCMRLCTTDNDASISSLLKRAAK
jgi:hypothetical protein